MSNKQRGCRRVRAALMRAADDCREGGIELEERFAVDLHLESCADCRALHEELAIFGEGAARLTARAETAANRLDLEGALARLEGALDAAPLDAPVGDPLAGMPETEAELGHTNQISAFRRSLPLLAAAASIAACTTLFIWWQRTQSEKDSGPASSDTVPSEFVAGLDGGAGEVVGDPEGRSPDPVADQDTESGAPLPGEVLPQEELPQEELARIDATDRLMQALACAFPEEEARTP